MYSKTVILTISCVLALAQFDLLSASNILIAENKEIVTNARVVGGHDALVGQFPHLVSLQCGSLINSRHICTGSIIHPLWILTSAHCYFTVFTKCPLISDIIVRAGKHDINSKETFEQAVRAYRKGIVHEGHTSGTYPGPNDIALLKLQTLFLLNDNVKIIRLPLPFTEHRGKVQVAGWGNTNGARTINEAILQTVELPIININVCNASINVFESAATGLLQNSNICTGPLTGGISPCIDDSGAPLTTTVNGAQELVGVMSWTFSPCGIEGSPAVSVKVSYYVFWILDKMARN